MSEIRRALEQVRTRLNDFISAADPRPGEWVVLSNLFDQNGEPYEGAQDKLVMMLANVLRENTIGTANPAIPATPDSYALVAPPIYVDLYILFYANFSGATYPEGLGILSRTISFFQQNPVFTRQNLPELPPPVEKLVFEMTNLDVTEVNHLVGMVGAHYLPLVYYKVRMIPFEAGAITASVAAVHQLQNPGEHDESVSGE